MFLIQHLGKKILNLGLAQQKVKRRANTACAIQPHRKLSDHACYG